MKLLSVSSSFCLNPNRSLDHSVSGILVFVLFPNIFYFLIGILSVFLTDVARYACVPKPNNLFDNKTKYVQALMIELG